jgi:hypothetical protein
MRLSLPTGVLRLGHGELLRIDDAGQGRTLLCLRGTVLVSQEGILADETLAIGDSLCLRPRGCVLIEGWGAAEVRLALSEGQERGVQALSGGRSDSSSASATGTR